MKHGDNQPCNSELLFSGAAQTGGSRKWLRNPKVPVAAMAAPLPHLVSQICPSVSSAPNCLSLLLYIQSDHPWA